MCDNGKYFFYFTRLIAMILSFIIYFKKSQSYKKRAKKNSVKRDEKTRTKS